MMILLILLFIISLLALSSFVHTFFLLRLVIIILVIAKTILFGIAMPMLHDLNSQNVTITWYRLSRLLFCLSHTLSPFLTLLNQK